MKIIIVNAANMWPHFADICNKTSLFAASRFIEAKSRRELNLELLTTPSSLVYVLCNSWHTLTL